MQEESESSTSDDAYGANVVHEVPTVIPTTLSETNLLENIGHDDTAQFLVIDTGCRRSVAGTWWMRRLSQRMKAGQGCTPAIRTDKERFKFGDGPLRKSEWRACVPLGLSHFVVYLHMNLLPSGVLPLASRVFLDSGGSHRPPPCLHSHNSPASGFGVD